MSSALPWAGMAMSSSAQEKTRTHHHEVPVSLCLNAYSFNRLLRAGEMSLKQLFSFAKATGFQGVDLTAYYIPGYPEVPADEVLYAIKKMAFRMGLALTGTGVRNNFTLADPEKRKQERQLVKNWVLAAAKLGVPHVRIFDGIARPEGHSREAITAWVIEDMKACTQYGQEHGVMISYQNHNNFTSNAQQVMEIMEQIDSPWFGLMLDIGSLPEGDVYQEIERLTPYAITWQIKELVETGGKKVRTDFGKLMQIIRASGYQGYLPLETLGQGDPYQKVKTLYEEVSDLLYV
jgi:sugar phosphate isomerase/epimerase